MTAVAILAAAAGSPWDWEPRPDVWLLVFSLSIAYWWATTKLRERQPGDPPEAPGPGERVRFILGVGVLWAAADWPMDRLGDDFLFSAHMAQFLMMTMIAVPLLMTGIPSWLKAELVAPFADLIRRVGAPLALISFQVVLVATHLPRVVEVYGSNQLVHFGLHATWILTAFVFWLPVLGWSPVYEPLSHPGIVAYLIAATILPTIPASFLTWASTPFYDSYAEAPRVFGISPIDDLQLAGIIMKLGGGAILWGFIIWFFAQWAAAAAAAEPALEPVVTRSALLPTGEKESNG